MGTAAEEAVMYLLATFFRGAGASAGDWYCERGRHDGWGRTRARAYLCTWLTAPVVWWLRCRWARLGLIWAHYTDPRPPPL